MQKGELTSMKTHELTIEGMSCGHCVMHVKKELSRVKDLVVDDVQIGKAKVSYDDGNVTQESIALAVEHAGYKLVAMS